MFSSCYFYTTLRPPWLTYYFVKRLLPLHFGFYTLRRLSSYIATFDYRYLSFILIIIQYIVRRYPLPPLIRPSKAAWVKRDKSHAKKFHFYRFSSRLFFFFILCFLIRVRRFGTTNRDVDASFIDQRIFLLEKKTNKICATSSKKLIAFVAFFTVYCRSYCYFEINCQIWDHLPHTFFTFGFVSLLLISTKPQKRAHIPSGVSRVLLLQRARSFQSVRKPNIIACVCVIAFYFCDLLNFVYLDVFVFCKMSRDIRTLATLVSFWSQS